MRAALMRTPTMTIMLTAVIVMTARMKLMLMVALMATAMKAGHHHLRKIVMTTQVSATTALATLIMAARRE